MVKTSDTHPLRIDSVDIPYTGGVIGMTFCPGKKGPGLFSGDWDRNLAKDVGVIHDWGADALVSLLEDHEFSLLGVPDFKEVTDRAPFAWFHLPIVDVSVPDDNFERNWTRVGNVLRGILAQGGKVVLHCRGGLGRTGLVAARLLVEFGVDAGDALKQVRAARPGAVETPEQEQYVHAFKTVNGRRSLDHYLGCLLGGAIGDALGAAVEFMSLSEIRDKYGKPGIKMYDKAYGRNGAITDDTQMTLFTAEGLLRANTRAAHKGIGPSFQSCGYYAYRRWLVTQGELQPGEVDMDGWLVHVSELHHQRAPGKTCLSALKLGRVFQFGSSRPHNASKGCGAVMRSAPVGLFFQSPYVCGFLDDHMRDERCFETGRDLGYLTHGNPSGYWAAAFLSLLIGRLIDGDSLSGALDTTTSYLKGQPGAEETLDAIARARALASHADNRPSPEALVSLGEGWVGEEALAIAIYCALVAGDDFDFGIRLAVNHGGDSDSTGAIAGNILGALSGRVAIGHKWLDSLELKGVIEQIAIDLFLAYRDERDWQRRYPGH